MKRALVHRQAADENGFAKKRLGTSVLKIPTGHELRESTRIRRHHEANLPFTITSLQRTPGERTGIVTSQDAESEANSRTV